TIAAGVGRPQLADRIFASAVSAGRAGSAGQKDTFQSPINFVRIAYRTNSAVDEILSLRIADARWVSTVFTLRFKTAPTDLLVCPSAISCTTLCSREDSRISDLSFLFDR